MQLKDVTRFYTLKLDFADSLNNAIEKLLEEQPKFNLKVLNFDNSLIACTQTREEAVTEFLKVHPVFDRTAIDPFIYQIYEQTAL